MHLKALILTFAFCCLLSSKAYSQIGWTPQQMEAKYGKPTSTMAYGPRLLRGFYKVNPKISPAVSQLGFDSLSITYWDGKAQEMSIQGRDLFPRADLIGTSLIEANPDQSRITNRIIGQGQVSYYGGTSGSNSYDYKGYTAIAGFLNSHSPINIVPKSGSRLEREMADAETKAIHENLHQDDAKTTKALR